MTLILDGKLAQADYAMRLKKRVEIFGFPICLAVVQIGNKEESSAYIKKKIKFGEEIGVQVRHVKMPKTVSVEDVLVEINKLNSDRSVGGIIVQLPLPENLSKARDKILNSIAFGKDADGLSVQNKESRALGKGILPATARGVMELLDFYNIKVENKKVAVLGRSILAGGPIAEAIQRAGGFVTVCNSKTPLEEEKRITSESDIIVIAIGKPKFLTEEFLMEGGGQIVVDVGINRVTPIGVEKLKEEISQSQKSQTINHKPSHFVGDVDFENVSRFVRAISPVPGGVGQMTVLALFENVLDCVENL
jgi:methylenetetrahydrofolate dehydrogenase (NADP+)/methenyltetrahydrofolate cyclohydrolase